MQAAGTRKRAKASIEGTARQADVSPEAAHQLVAILENVRQGYLDALPIAAAIITADGGEATIECANDHFRFIAEWDERLGDRQIRHVPILRSGPIGTPKSSPTIIRSLPHRKTDSTVRTATEQRQLPLISGNVETQDV